MNRKFFFLLVFLVPFLLLFIEASGVGRFFRIHGDFMPSSSWSGGYPWRALFDIGNTNSGYQAGIDADGYLSGYFWLGNVGWWVFNHTGSYTLPRAHVLCENSVFNDPTITCPVDGYAWTQNAGWIALSWSWIWTTYSSWVYYNPASGRLEWFWHSQALWWVPFYAEASTPVSSGGMSQSGILFHWVGLNFIGKIAIIGNAAGTKIFNVANQQIGFTFDSIHQAEILNNIRKNIAGITRNVDTSLLSDPFSSFPDFLYIKDSDLDTRWGGWTWPASKKTIIVIWWDVILDPATIWLDTVTDRAMIVLKNESGSGGNIIITENVGRIYGFLYAEGSLYSGEKTATWEILPYIDKWAWNIPGNQLYIKWAIISKNTIWWSLQTPPTCPVVINNCTLADAQHYDLNYFRTYDPSDSTQKNVPYNDPRFNAASTIIEYNPLLSESPPPALENIFP